MNTPKTGMRTILAAAAAGALVLGSAAGVSAAPKAKPAPQSNDRLQSVSLTNHRTIDLAKVDASSAITLRAKVWDPNRDGKDRAISLKVGLYTKKVDGKFLELAGPVDAPESVAAPLALKAGDELKKVKHYSATALLSTLWTPDELAAVDTALDPGEKAYLCISSVVVEPNVNKYSVQVAKRLGKRVDGNLVKKPVRDCVKVIDSVDTAS